MGDVAVTPDEMRNRDLWGPAEICERLDALVAVLDQKWLKKIHDLVAREGAHGDAANGYCAYDAVLAIKHGRDELRTECERLRAALRSVREQLKSDPYVNWVPSDVQETIAEALGET